MFREVFLGFKGKVRKYYRATKSGAMP